MEGGDGDDTLNGGTEADTFAFPVADGSDAVTDATATVSITLNGVGTGLITAEDFLFA